jgi:anti-repressor protein
MNKLIKQSIDIEETNLTPIEIALGIDEEGRTTARKLYEFLELAKGQFSRWSKTNILENAFATENEDYEGFDINVEGNETTDYKLSASFAKKLAMGTHNKKGEAAKNYFIKVEEKLKEIAMQPKKLSALEQLQLQNQAILEVNEKVDKIQNDMPLFKAECDELQSLVRKTGINLMNGKNTLAYKDNSLRGRVYSDIQHQLRREFGVDKYAWIKHSQFNHAKEIVSNYELPTVLKDEITRVNNQISFGKEDM